MTAKRYQVFVSSTYEDLRPEREALFAAFEQTMFIPAGMELFTASDSKSWDQIQQALDTSDYYICVVAGRYGGVSKDGISFTEAEYDYASKISLPRLVFLHHDRDGIAIRLSEQTPAGRGRLKKFIEKLETSHHREKYTDASDLKFKVIKALLKQVDSNPRPGWIRDISPAVAVEELIASLANKLDTAINLMSEQQGKVE